MPSGRRETYTETLGQIDWADLYERHDGYVLFEDLREQWFHAIQPDYVLIDSRTGHTDSSGICTRQLPDSVVILFFPNEQNLRGLSQVVSDIRNEAVEPRRKNIALHFVMSNVPNLDDDDLILQGKISGFQEHLGFQRDPLVIHRYDSLSLLNQVVFSKDRPRSRLAHEYRQIVQEIYTQNWNDRDGALEYIRRAEIPGRWLKDESILAREDRLDRIEQAHREDGEILFRLAELRESDRQTDAAAYLIDQAILHGCERPEAFLQRSRLRANADGSESDAAVEDLWRVLALEHVAPPMVREAVGRLAGLKRYESQRLIESNAVATLDLYGKYWLASTLDRSRDDLSIEVALWKQISESPDLPADRQSAVKSHLGLSYIGLGRFSEAVTVFRDGNRNVEDMDIAKTFNYGVALWGMNGVMDRKIFERVAEIDQANGGREETANYLQCMVIVCWATGKTDNAMDYLDRAWRKMISLRVRSEFSCWRYLRVGARTFEQDLDEMKALIEKDKFHMPRFMSKTGTIAIKDETPLPP